MKTMVCLARSFPYRRRDANKQSMVRFALLLIGADRTIEGRRVKKSSYWPFSATALKPVLLITSRSLASVNF